MCTLTLVIECNVDLVKRLFFSAADNLRNQRKFTITGLMPATEYQVQVEGHNAAGSTLADYNFFTLTEDGGKYIFVYVYIY